MQPRYNQVTRSIMEQIPVVTALYHRLILVAGPPRTGKSTILRGLAKEHSWSLVNVNLALSERLLELTTRQRALKVPRLLDQSMKEHGGDIIILDNTEVLFSLEFRQDPLRLLQELSRNRTVIAAWAGEQVGESLIYADPTHSEFKRYYKPDAVIVPVVDVTGTSEQTAKKEST